LPDGNGRDSGIAGWENMGMGFKFQMGMGMGMKSLKWEGIGTKNLFPHTSSTDTQAMVDIRLRPRSSAAPLVSHYFTGN